MDNPVENNTPAWYEAEGIDQNFVSDKVKGYTNADGSCNMAELLKSYDSAQRYIGGAVKIPTEKSTPEEVAAFYAKLGRPESADKYDWQQPEGIELKGEFFDGFKKAAHELGLTNKQLSGVLDGYTNIVKQIFSQKQAFAAEQEKTSRANLSKEWGDKFESKLGGVMDKLEKLGVKSALAEAGLLYDERILRAFHAISEDSQSSEIHNGGMSPDAVKSRIAEIRQHPGFMNAGHPEHNALVQEFNALFEGKA